MMGIIDRFGSGSNSTPEWTVVARKQDGTGGSRPDEIDDNEWRWVGDPPTKDNFKFEYGNLLSEELRYLCVEIIDNGLDFDEPAWVLEPEQKADPAAETAGAVYKEVKELKEQVDGEGVGDASLSDVESEDELQARLKGIVAEQGLKVAEDTDDVIRILDSIGSSREPVGHPMMDMMTDAQNNLEINSPTDMAMMMALPELKEVMQSGQQLMGNLQQMTGGGQSAGAGMAQQMMGGGQPQQQPQQQPQGQPAQTYQQPQSQPGNGAPAQSQPDQSATTTQSQSGSSFSMDEMVEEEPDQEDTEDEVGVPGEGNSPMTAAPDDVDSEPEAETQEESTSPLDEADSTTDAGPDEEPDIESESTDDEQTNDDDTTPETEVTA